MSPAAIAAVNEANHDMVTAQQHQSLLRSFLQLVHDKRASDDKVRDHAVAMEAVVKAHQAVKATRAQMFARGEGMREHGMYEKAKADLLVALEQLEAFMGQHWKLTPEAPR